MLNDHNKSMFNQAMQVLVEVEPIEEEGDDMDTLAFTEQIRFEMQQEIIDTKDYQIESIPVNLQQSATRSVDVLLLITAIGGVLAARQDLIITICKAVETVVEALAKRGRIQEIQIIANGRTLILKDISKKTAQELIATFESQYLGDSMQLSAQSPIQVKAKVSKKKKKNV